MWIFSHHAQEGADAMLSRLDGLKGVVDRDISGFEALQAGVQRDMTTTADLLAKGKVAQQVLKDCGIPVSHINLNSGREGLQKRTSCP